ncbi:DUF6443 domain-containing protein [Chryseobacterium rhizosphaerae]|uniref:DUF6443 domain-containing protein n=1 Tax=Chryseobacterium rhizosphaerae TaxID=395937 RepID=UPI002359FA1B|nr:DUF6443 domain-containing protein [Chryseobacterium rhizosphaerae]MDC8102346.1 RHS repeat-associated core domain-containing protein [Chryseobacterium rhizosphaerae]
MKKIIIPIGILVMTGAAHAQLSPTENYVYTKTYLDYNEATPPKTSETVQYFDGLGRVKQTVNIKASPLGKDVVTPVLYDGFGRQTRDYLAVPQSGTQNGGIYPQTSTLEYFPVGDPQSLYTNEKPFSEKILENSPLDRIQQQIQVGAAWAGKAVKFDYAANINGEVRKLFTTTTSVNNATKSTIENGGTYASGQLYKNSITDEDGNLTIEFKNGKGQLVLSRKVLNVSENADTYYVYNEYDQLAWVIPPMLSRMQSWGTAEQDALAYEYRYDDRNRLVEKKLPGKGWEYMVYDKQDRAVLVRDAVMEPKGQWLFTKYDKFGRIAYTGILSGGGRAAMQSQVGSQNIVEEQSSLGFNKNGIMVYYSNTYFSDFVTVLTINYYDTYPRDTKKFPPAKILDQYVISYDTDISTLGMATASYVKNIEDDHWTKTYFYYDNRGRTVGTYSVNHLGGYTNTESQLDFSGIPKKTITTHKRTDGEIGVTVAEHFEYDAQNRLLKHYHQVDSQPEQLLTENTYNELSQLSNKKVGNNLQSIDYTYNIRGWMTDINKDQMAVPDLSGKLFSYKIKYNQREGIENPDQTLFPGKNVKANYNGNISEVDWRTVESLGANPPTTPKRYGYAYDTLNRLSAGYYQNPNNPYSKEHTESLEYDLNGNIQKLYRTAAAINTIPNVIDNLVYTYTSGNQVSKITDNGNSAGYEGGGKPIEYDQNGNMRLMLDKNISNINYNYLNLPNNIVYGFGFDGGIHQYLYRADGVKLQKKIPMSECGIINCYTVTDTSDYLDGFHYFRSVSSGSGGGLEELRQLSQKTKYAYEQQAYTIGEGTPIDDSGHITTPPLNGLTATVKTADLRFFPTAEGFYDYQKDQYIYQYKDHLGNVRISFGRSSAGVLAITDINDYYPFGMNHLNSGNSLYGKGIYQNYKYNGKELQETGMYDYGARFYMPDLGRWGVVDPLAETSRRWSPYNYAFNNPIRFIDPDGQAPQDIIFVFNGKNNTQVQVQYKQGNFYYLNGDRAGQKYDGRTQRASTNLFRLAKAYRAIEHSNNAILKDRLHTLENSDQKHYIFDPQTPNQPSGMEGTPGVGSKTVYNFKSKNEKERFEKTEGVPLTDLSLVSHEMQHQYDKDTNNQSDATNDNDANNPSEQRAVKTENEARKLEGVPLRTTYGGIPVNPNPQNYTKPKDDKKK